MATKADFTSEEWELLQQSVTGAGLLVSLSDRSSFDTFKEAGALGKHIAQAKRSVADAAAGGEGAEGGAIEKIDSALR